MSTYPLTGRHLEVPCEKCHEQHKYINKKTECADCHEDVHEGRLKSACSECHDTRGFQAPFLLFDHNIQTDFPLTPLHGNSSCEKCHADATYEVAGSTCESCHVEAEEFFSGRLFPDLLPPSPDPMFGLVKCVDCHHLEDTRADAKFVRPRCVSCHNGNYSLYLDQARSTIEAGALSIKKTLAGKEKDRIRKDLDILRRFSPHNFIYAHRLLKVLGR